MFKKAIVALTIAVAFTGTALTFSAPAEANDWLAHRGFVGHHWGWYPHNHFYGHAYYAPGGDCYWAWRPVRIWTPNGHEYVSRHVEVCN